MRDSSPPSVSRRTTTRSSRSISPSWARSRWATRSVISAPRRCASTRRRRAKNFAFTPNTANNYNVRERVCAAFLMGTLKYDWGSIVGGARVEHLKNRGIAALQVGNVFTPVTKTSDQTLIFPSLHFNYNLDDSKKLRLSFNSDAARADYDQIRPNYIVTDSDRSISAGNPDEARAGLWRRRLFRMVCEAAGLFDGRRLLQACRGCALSPARSFRLDRVQHPGLPRSRSI